jgi:hypothetical protein
MQTPPQRPTSRKKCPKNTACKWTKVSQAKLPLTLRRNRYYHEDGSSHHFRRSQNALKYYIRYTYRIRNIPKTTKNHSNCSCLSTKTLQLSAITTSIRRYWHYPQTVDMDKERIYNKLIYKQNHKITTNNESK